MLIQQFKGQTALHFAHAFRYQEVADFLVKNGADDALLNDFGLTCYEGLGNGNVIQISASGSSFFHGLLMS